MGDDETFELIQEEGKLDEYKCKDCEKSYSAIASVRRHISTKHKKKEESETPQPLEEGNADDFEFDPDNDETPKSTQNADKTLSAEDIVKMYEEKEEQDEASENVETDHKENEQTLFPEKEVILEMLNTVDANEDLDVNQVCEIMKTEIETLKNLVKQKDKMISEKEENLVDKEITITTLKDEIEAAEKESEKKNEENEILIASVNSLEEEKSCLKVKVKEESTKVEKVNHTLKKIFKEKECLQKEGQNLKNTNKVDKKSENDDQGMKKKLSDKQKEINDLKEKNKKLADELAEKQEKSVQENPNNLILTNLLKTRTAEMKRIEKEKEKIQKKLDESESKLKETNIKLTKVENTNIRLESEVDNLVEILGKKVPVKPNQTRESDEERVQVFQMDGKPKRCSFNNKAICRNNNCSFAHSNFVCKPFSQYGVCDQGIQCPGRHPTGVCHKWRNGGCHMTTEACHFRHPEDDANSDRENEQKRKRSEESHSTSRPKNARVELDESRNDFLCKSLSDLHRKIDAYEKKEKEKEMKEEMVLSQSKFSAPPVPPFTNVYTSQTNTQPSYSMVQPSGLAVTPAIQPVGRGASPNPAPIRIWTQQPQQATWVGQPGRQRMEPVQVQQNILQESLNVPFPGGQVFSQFYQ